MGKNDSYTGGSTVHVPGQKGWNYGDGEYIRPRLPKLKPRSSKRIRLRHSQRYALEEYVNRVNQSVENRLEWPTPGAQLKRAFGKVLSERPVSPT